MWKKIRYYFVTGIIILLPSVVTFYILAWLFGKVDGFLGRPIQNYFGVHIPGLGAALTLTLILLAGIVGTHILGREVIKVFDDFLCRIPLIRGVYRTTRQIVDAFTHPHNGAFQKVALIEYPRKGIYGIGFITGVTKGEVQDKTQETVVNVFLPTTPNPTSGFLLLVPEEDVIPLDMSVEDGLKLIISGGVVTPPDSACECERLIGNEGREGTD